MNPRQYRKLLREVRALRAARAHNPSLSQQLGQWPGLSNIYSSYDSLNQASNAQNQYSNLATLWRDGQ